MDQERVDLFGHHRRRDADEPDLRRGDELRNHPPRPGRRDNSTGLSMIPEGIEKTIVKPEMADLIAFLRASNRGGEGQRADADDRTRPLEIGTPPGLIEPEETALTSPPFITTLGRSRETSTRSMRDGDVATCASTKRRSKCSRGRSSATDIG